MTTKLSNPVRIEETGEITTIDELAKEGRIISPLCARSRGLISERSTTQ